MSGKKKAEFPDAFIFDATRKYLEKHPNEILLVISKDSDWTTAFNQIENIIICDSISNALTKISNIDSILSHEMLSQIFRGAYKEIISNAQQKVEYENFELDDYENLNELEIESVKVDRVSDNFIPLKIARDSLLLCTKDLLNLSSRGTMRQTGATKHPSAALRQTMKNRFLSPVTRVFRKRFLTTCLTTDRCGVCGDSGGKSCEERP